ncbi:phage antirepressor KilAC domain-containing protein [Bacillus infantis]|uniref:phage antirepressor KilAC domain-containing protein n=1 Tax=Bacillus infantis TaxID=324767 RepID=UPI003CF70D05
MNNLAVKEVNFNGDTLMAAQDQTNEKVYVGVRWVCEGLNLTRGQLNNEVKKVQEDFVLKKLARNLMLDTGYGFKDVLCIELEGLPLWLAKISITPKMQKESPETVEKLVSYQLKAKEVLANAFVHNVKQIVPKTYKEALLALVESIEEKEKLESENKIMQPKAIVYDQIASAKNLVGVNKVAKNMDIGEIKLFEFLRATRVFYKEGDYNLPFQRYQNQGLFHVKVQPTIDNYGVTRTTYTIKVTGKGELFILDLVNKYGGAKVINKLKVKDIQSHVRNYKLQGLTVVN